MNPKKSILMSSSKILPEVRQRMGPGKSVDVIIGREDFCVSRSRRAVIDKRDVEREAGLAPV
jgi:hypothetical protein